MTQSEKLYKRREEYKAGWVHGFYDCRVDDGSAFRADVLLNGRYRPRAEFLFWRGYRDGKAVGRGHLAYPPPYVFVLNCRESKS